MSVLLAVTGDELVEALALQGWRVLERGPEDLRAGCAEVDTLTVPRGRILRPEELEALLERANVTPRELLGLLERLIRQA